MSIPTLSFASAFSPDTKPAFLNNLRNALFTTGFLYLSDTGVPDALVEQVITLAHAFFTLPTAEKMKLEMKNKDSFLGYSVLGNEITARQKDWREQIDLSTEHPIPGPDAPRYQHLRAPNQWPTEDVLQNFQKVYADYIARMGTLSMQFTTLIAEALGLPPNAFDPYFDADQQHKLKVVRYPDLTELGIPEPKSGEGPIEYQGVGPHKDSMLSSYLLQATDQRGLQVLLPHGPEPDAESSWIDVPPVKGTVVVALGQALEAFTGGVCRSTTHRVLNPIHGEGSRISVPFFQGVGLDVKFSDIQDLNLPQHVRDSKRDLEARLAAQRGQSLPSGRNEKKVDFAFTKGGKFETLGEATFFNRCKSHLDVTERWYNDVYQQIMKDREAEARKSEDETKSDAKTVTDGDARRLVAA